VLLQRTEDVLFVADEVRQTPIPRLLTHLGGSLGFTGIPFYTTLFWVYCFVAVTLIAAFRLKESSFGRGFLSVRENEIAAEAMGINTTRFKVRAFVLAAFFAGIAGGLFAHEVGTTLNPRELGFQKSFEIVIMVVLGGSGSISGAVLAAIGLTVLPELLRSFSDYRMIAYALTLIVTMIVRPRGLLGVRELWQLPALRRKS
jgi:branched-chain amino acid transport system permease protein